MSYKIMSFNIQKFSLVATADSGKKDMDTIAKIICESGADIVAIQEVFNKEALKNLLEKIDQQYAKEDHLKTGNKNREDITRKSVRTSDVYGYYTKHWEGRWAKPRTGFGDNIAEGYAFLWNRDRIKLVTNYDGEIFEPRIETFSGKNKLVRPPFVGRFMPIHARYEFRLINTHIVFSAPTKMKDEEESLYKPDITDLQLRNSELEQLISSVYTRFDKKQFDVTGNDKNARLLSAYTFLLGDYNLNLADGHGSKISCSLKKYVKEDWEIVTVNEELTTLKTKEPEKKSNNPQDYLANNYDHFSYDEKKLNRQNIAFPETEVIAAYNRYKANKTDGSQYEQYREKVSDHLPILLTIQINKKQAER